MIGRNDKEVDLKLHLGGNVYVSVSSKFPLVDIRQFWLPEQETQIKASRKGISLRSSEWEELKQVQPLIEAAIPEISTTIPCLMRDDHMNQLGMLACRECNPNGY